MKKSMMLAVAACVLASCHTATQKEEREFVGNWLEVMPVNSQFTQGVTLNADGTAASIGMATPGRWQAGAQRQEHRQWADAGLFGHAGRGVPHGRLPEVGQKRFLSHRLLSGEGSACLGQGQGVARLPSEGGRYGSVADARLSWHVASRFMPGHRLRYHPLQSLTYLEAEDGKDQTYEFCGRQYTLRGNAVDKNATVLQFVPFDKAEDTMNFLFGGDKLTMLDRELRPIDSNLNYTLQLQ